jgi:hypothetical protein
MNVRNTAGYTALMFAARYGFFKTVQILLERGADINVRNEKGQTAFDLAKEEGREVTMSLLEPPEITESFPRCPICLVNDSNVCCVPCGHTLCKQCSVRLKGKQCHMCRSYILMFVKIMFST